MSDWDILDDNGSSDDGDVEYVGVVEEDGPESYVREPARRSRQPVRRVGSSDQVMYPINKSSKNRNGVVGAPNREAEDLVSYVNMPHGKQLGLTPEAIKRLRETPMMNFDGHMAQRIEPGTYVMYGPSRAAGMGTDPLYDEIIATQSGGSQPFTSSAWAQEPARDTSWIGGLIQGVSQFGSGLATAISQGRIAEREAVTERLRIAAETAAASEARAYAYQEAQLEHAERLAEIEQGVSELEALREQAAAAAALRAGIPPTTTTTVSASASPALWIILGLVGLSAVGGVIWYVSRDKEKDSYDRYED